MVSRAAPEVQGRCAYCGRVTKTPRKVKYHLSVDDTSARYSHHRQTVQVNGVEVLPICRMVALQRFR